MPADERVVALELFANHFRACVMASDFQTIPFSDQTAFIARGEAGIRGASWNYGKLIDEMERTSKGKAEFKAIIKRVLEDLVKAALIEPEQVTRVGVAIT